MLYAPLKRYTKHWTCDIPIQHLLEVVNFDEFFFDVFTTLYVINQSVETPALVATRIPFQVWDTLGRVWVEPRGVYPDRFAPWYSAPRGFALPFSPAAFCPAGIWPAGMCPGHSAPRVFPPRGFPRAFPLAFLQAGIRPIAPPYRSSARGFPPTPL